MGSVLQCLGIGAALWNSSLNWNSISTKQIQSQIKAFKIEWEGSGKSVLSEDGSKQSYMTGRTSFQTTDP